MIRDKRCEMQETGNEILAWLPSPLGDAVLCTPALRAIRQHFKSSKITFFGKPVNAGTGRHLVPITSEPIGSHGVDDNQDDVFPVHPVR